ncbi:HK97 gp10 family phage protein [Terrihalobacillus insolitus]|uniref:HK97 gp10 family phage protein n=1 Tax=Terrihalobacillus insolitus TaxID=2950438 RepID=UPI0023425274|nr:HK97 gp10 family phage protein [Terrihalobacillus insolitus]MDC3414269.1 hypothetical protein [Terrihalobacillus insolitus]
MPFMDGELKISRDIEIFFKNYNDLAPEAIENGLNRIAKDAPKEAQKSITSKGLIRTGKLRKSISGEVKDNNVIVGAKPFYAAILEDGARAHKIKKKKGFLNIPGVGYRKSVNHPGVKSTKFLSGTIDDMSKNGEIETIFSAGVAEAMKGAGLNG